MRTISPKCRRFSGISNHVFICEDAPKTTKVKQIMKRIQKWDLASEEKFRQFVVLAGTFKTL